MSDAWDLSKGILESNFCLFNSWTILDQISCWNGVANKWSAVQQLIQVKSSDSSVSQEESDDAGVFSF